jgi:hypothetical protein
MSLKYAKDADIKGFVGVPDQFAIYGQSNTFADTSTATPKQRIDEIFTMSNNCRDGSTIFSDEQAFHPVSQDMTAQMPSNITKMEMAVALTEPPMKKKEHPYMTALLIGAGVFVLYKILS